MAESSESARSSSKSLRGSGKATRRKLVLAESSLKAEQYVSSLSEESGPGLGGDDSRAPAEDANNDEQPPTKRARLSDSPGAIVEHIDDSVIRTSANEAGENFFEAPSDQKDVSFLECDSDAARSCVNDSGSEEDSFAAEEIDEVDNEDDTKSIDDESSAEEGDKEPDDDDPNLFDPVAREANRAKSLRLLSVAYYIKHGLSKVALRDFLSAMNIAADDMPKEMRSPFTLLKQYDHLKRDIERVFVCRSCPRILENGPDGFPKKQQPCGHPFSRKEKHVYTLLLDVKHQLKYFLEHYGMKRTSHDANQVGDVTSGQCYKDCMNDLGEAAGRTMTLLANFDGAEMYSSSKWNFWPFMILINEVPYHIRRENVILVGIHHCEGKPGEESFVAPCVERLRKLEEEGIDFNGIHYNVRLLIVSADTIARPVVRNTTQFNGKFGCDFCLHPGFSVKPEPGKRAQHRYCEKDNDGNLTKFPLRTTEQHFKDVEAVLKATGKNPRINGIKGTSALLELENLDFIKAFVPDYLHSMCLGVIKRFVHLWISNLKDNKNKPWYIGGKIAVVNSRLSRVLPPIEITRTPCKEYLDKTTFWKAHEYKAFALYYYPVLEGILPEPYFSHFAFFSHGLYILLQEEVDLESVQKTRRLLDHFVAESETLYGRIHTTYNLHLTTHLCQSVQDWGCLWASSTFVPEWFNGQLQSMVHGTQAPVEQMASTFLIRSAVRDEVIDLMKTVQLPKNIINLFNNLLHLPPSLLHANGIWNTKSKVLPDGIALLGQSSLRPLGDVEVRALRELVDATYPMESAIRQYLRSCTDACNLVGSFYPKIQLKNGTVFTTSSYKRSKKRCNYCALLRNGEFIDIVSIYMVSQVSDQQCFIFASILGQKSKSYFVPSLITNVPDDVQPIIIPKVAGQLCRLTQLDDCANLVALLPQSIAKKAVVIMKNDLNNMVVVGALANSIERD